jgi:hypothetical protein
MWLRVVVVLKPKAPASIASRRSARIRAISSGRAARSKDSSPIT